MRIVLVAGEPAFRFGIRVVVETAADLEWGGDAGDARSGFGVVDSQKPEVVLIDVALKGMNGIDATREVKRRAPKTKVLLLSSWLRERDVIDGFAAGADGFALKTESVESLREAIRAVGSGHRYLTPEARGLTLQTATGRAASEPRDVLSVLSLREREVLGLVVKGCRSRDIARELCISIKTVETHRNHINRKLGCASAADLTRFAAENGLLRSPPANIQASVPERTMVLFVDDDPKWRAEFLRVMAAQGYQCGQAPTATRALAELRDTPAPSVLVIDSGPGAARVRAVASMAQTDASQWFAAALDSGSSAGLELTNGRTHRLA
jgi:DNA-binding NarL/FixJ family response regulator